MPVVCVAVSHNFFSVISHVCVKSDLFELTVTDVRTSRPALVIVVLHLVVVCDVVLPAFWLIELRAAAALFALFVGHLPLLHCAQGQISTEENVERSVNMFHEVVAHKNYAIEAVEDHAYLHRAVPFVMTTW